MSTTIDETLQRALRDACLSVYLDDVATLDPNLGDAMGRLTTPEDVYEYLLIDPLVEPAVQTSRGALAVASLQQYVNGIIMGLEPGYEAKLSDGDVAEWREKDSQYPLWAANMMLASYPEAYIDPTLRIGKSGYFQDLEQTINQGKINTDTVGDAVLDYLSRFEEVANLKVINGYIANHEMAEGIWYFIGKPRTECTKYYWRSVDMTRHADDVQDLAPGAWSDWEPVDFPVTEGSVIGESSIRPVFFNNRLYVVWAEKQLMYGDTRVKAEYDGEKSEAGEPPLTVLSLKMIYRRYDGTWSTPFTYARTEVDEDPVEPLQTIAFYDVSMAPHRLIIGMYYGFRKDRDSELGFGNACTFMRNVQIDQSFNVERVFPVNRERDDMETVPESTPMGITEKYIRAVYHFLLVRSGKLDHPERTVLVAETALIRSKGMEQVIANGENTFGQNFPGVLDALSIVASDVTATSVTLSARLPLAGFNWLEGETEALYIESGGANSTVLWGYLTPHYREGAKFLRFGQVSRYASVGLPEANGSSYILSIATSSYLAPLLNPSLSLANFSSRQHIDLGLNDYCFGYSDGMEDDLIQRRAQLRFSIPGGSVVRTQEIEAAQESQYRAATLELEIFDPYHGGSARAVVHRGQADAIVRDPIRFALRIGPEDEAVDSTYEFIVRALDASGNPLAHAKRILTIKPGGSTIIVPPGQDKGVPPHLAHQTDATLGTAEYIDFAGSEMATVSDVAEDDEPHVRRPIRMNTLFANALINKANHGLEHLLQWSVQQMPEPPMAGQQSGVTMDFHGANGIYFWELFFHLPFLVSYRLNREQSHADAERWLRFIFDHTDKTGDSGQGKPPYWNVVPLAPRETVAGRLTDLVFASTDPDVIAAGYPVHYRKAIFLHFIRNLIDRGDLAYRQQTPDSVTEAKQWYMHAVDLLGPAPETAQVSQWTPRPLAELAGATHEALRAWEHRVANDLLRIPLHGRAVRAPRELNPHFRLPLNETMLESWRSLATRLYNLRHSLTLDGKPMTLPLFAPPLDPRALQASRSQAGGAVGGRSAGAVTWPHFRYVTLHERAQRGADLLVQFGNSILMLFERKERVQQEQLQQAQLWEMSDFIRTGHQLNIDALAQSKVALERTRDTVDVRRRHYQALYDENVSAGETWAMALSTSSKAFALAAGVSYGVAHMTRVAPNQLHVGASVTQGMAIGMGAHASVGGMDWGAIAYAAGVGFAASAERDALASYILSTTETWRRRRQEWELQYRLAEAELEQIDEQVHALELQLVAARHMATQAKEEQARQKTMLDFLTSRFAGDALYQWLLGQLCAAYFQAYDLVVGLCMSAEVACQYETGDYATRFIRPGGWNDTWRGLSVGENLKLDLLRMDSAYLAGRQRELEITRTVSLREELTEATWQGVLDNLRGKGALAESGAGDNGKDGRVVFELSERLFDKDYPGMYLRRLTSVGVSIPAVLGAYQDVKAILSQTASYVVASASPDAVESLLDADVDLTDQVKLNLRPGQQIVLSHGMDDTGTFVPVSQDERYLAFEGTGAVSDWLLKFPHPTSAAQVALFDSLTDIILHVRYTARYGGQAFEQEVIELLEKTEPD